MATTVLKWRPRGPVLFAGRNTSVTPNKPTVFGAANCADQVSMALNATFATHNSKCNALDLEDFRMIKALSSELTVDLTDYTPTNVIAALNANSTAAGSATAVTNEVLPAGLLVGDTVAVGGANPRFSLTLVTVVDNAAASLVLNTNYSLDAANGMITILDLGVFTQPFKVNYTYQNPQILAALMAGQVERWIRFNGFNTANASKLVNVDMFRVLLAPSTAFDLLPDEHGVMQLKGGVLYDGSRAANDVYGQFFSIALAA